MSRKCEDCRNNIAEWRFVCRQIDIKMTPRFFYNIKICDRCRNKRIEDIEFFNDEMRKEHESLDGIGKYYKSYSLVDD